MATDGAAGAGAGAADPAGGAAGGAGGAAGGSGGAPDPAGGAGGGEKPFYETFTSEDLKTSPSIQRYKSPEDLAGAYVALEKRYGIDPNRRVDLPADMSDKEAMKAVWAKLGAPEKADGYGFKLDDKATDADKAFLGRATETMAGLGMPAEHAKGIFEFWQAETAKAAEAQTAANEAARAEGEASVRKEWGAAYDQRAKEVGNMLLKHFGANIAEALTPEKLGNHPELVIGLGKVLDAMAEPGAGGDMHDRGGAPRDQLMTPSQAKAEVRRIEGDPELGKALRNRDHPRHKEIVDRRIALLQMADPPSTDANAQA